MLIVRPKCTCEEKSMETAAIVHYVRRQKSTINDQHPLPHTNAGHHPIISVRPSVSAPCFAFPFNSLFSARHSKRTDHGSQSPTPLWIILEPLSIPLFDVAMLMCTISPSCLVQSLVCVAYLAGIQTIYMFDLLTSNETKI